MLGGLSSRLFYSGGHILGSEKFGSSFRLETSGGSHCFVQGCVIDDSVGSGKRTLTLEHPSLENCFDACTVANMTELALETPGNGSKACEWNEVNARCSVSNETTKCWDGNTYSTPLSRRPSMPCSSRFICLGAENWAFDFSLCPDADHKVDRLIVGAVDDSDVGVKAGSATLFTRRPDGDGVWEQTYLFHAEDAMHNDDYGASVFLYSPFLFISATHDDLPGYQNINNHGSVYAYVNSQGTAWEMLQKLSAPMPADNEHFGRSLTSDGVKWLAIAATGWQSIGSDTRGAVFVYAYNASNASSPRWEYRQMINSSMSSHFFGNAIAMSGQTLVVGSSAEDVDGTVLNQGAVYIYELGTNGVSWNLKERLVAHDGSASDFFGHALDIRGNNMLIGAHHDDNANGVTNPGAVYFFQRNETSWVQKQKILLPQNESSRYFGAAIAMSMDGMMATIGATGDVTEFGNAYIYSFNFSEALWSPARRLENQNKTAINHRFGSVVAMSSGLAGVGAELADLNSTLTDVGTVEAFNIFPDPPHIVNISVGNTNVIIWCSLVAGNLEPVIQYMAETSPGCQRMPSGVCLPRKFHAISKQSIPIGNVSSAIVTDSVGNHTYVRLNVTGLSNGEPYTFRVSAKSSLGRSPHSSVRGPFIPAEIPYTPGKPITVPGNADMFVTCDPPSWDGGGPITSYTAVISPGGGTLTNSTPWFHFIGLSNGIGYKVRIFATNWQGDSPVSEWSDTRFPAERPSAVAIRSFASADRAIIVDIAPPASNGGGIGKHWYLKRNAKDDSHWDSRGMEPAKQADGSTPVIFYRILDGANEVIAVGASQPVTAYNLTNGVSYNITVQAVNWQGGGVLSSRAVVIPATLPASPTITNFVVGEETALVTFTHNRSEDGGSIVTQYSLKAENTVTGMTAYFHIEGAAAISVSENGHGEILATSLNYDEIHTLRMYCENRMGESPMSAPVQVSPRMAGWKVAMVVVACFIIVGFIGKKYHAYRKKKKALRIAPIEKNLKYVMG